MTAASGLLHKEYHEKEFARKGGDFHMVQLWVNLPEEAKMLRPKYQPLTNEEMGKHFLDNDGGVIEVIAGNYFNTKGPASTFTPMAIMNAKLKKNGSASFEFPSRYNTALLLVEGSVVVNGSEAVPADHFVLFRNDGESFTLDATEDSIALVLSGDPIREPIAAQGPFVMNRKTEIYQAFEDLENGKFGHLED
jgi:redox-sensitive bicupin YhaK (pirin superfamily)